MGEQKILWFTLTAFLDMRAVKRASSPSMWSAQTKVYLKRVLGTPEWRRNWFAIAAATSDRNAIHSFDVHTTHTRRRRRPYRRDSDWGNTGRGICPWNCRSRRPAASRTLPWTTSSTSPASGIAVPLWTVTVSSVDAATFGFAFTLKQSHSTVWRIGKRAQGRRGRRRERVEGRLPPDSRWGRTPSSSRLRPKTHSPRRRRRSYRANGKATFLFLFPNNTASFMSAATRSSLWRNETFSSIVLSGLSPRASGIILFPALAPPGGAVVGPSFRVFHKSQPRTSQCSHSTVFGSQVSTRSRRNICAGKNKRCPRSCYKIWSHQSRVGIILM